MKQPIARSLLRRIALGLPLVEGPLELLRPLASGVLIVGVGLSAGCTRCDRYQSGTSTHPRSPFIEALVGTPESFDPAECDALCHALDDTSGARDAGMADAGSTLVGYPSSSATASCSYEGDLLVCVYEDTSCYTQSLCTTAVAGRAPAGLRRGHVARASGPAARWLAESARLERASVPAFEELALELERFGAPARLASAARRSAGDERRHARQVARLAARLGAPELPVERSEVGERTFFEVARDNAIEGCVRETFGALAAAMQAQHAESAAVRSVYRSIAADEARHALLSFAMNDWMLPQLDERDARRIDGARREALEQFVDVAAIEPEAELRSALGLPDATRSVDLLGLLA